MAEAYETQAFEEIYKHPNWKIEAETFENDFTKALYDDEAVKKEGQKALVQVSNILITYNQITEFQQGVEYTYTDERNKIRSGIEKCQATLDMLEKKEQSEELSQKDKEIREEAKAAIKRGEEKLVDLASKAKAEKEFRIKNKEVNAKDDEGQILSSLMLGGTGIGGQGYTITDNSIQDTRKGAQYIREQMTEKGTLLNQMALLDNAMNTGGIDLEGGGNTGDYLYGNAYGNDLQKKYGNDLQKKTLNDFLRDKDKVTLDATSQYLKDNGGEELNIEEIDKFREKNEEEQDQIIGAEGKGNNRMDIMDAARTRTLNDEAKARKGVKQTGLKGMWNSVKNFFGGGQKYVGALSQEEPQKKDKNKAPEQSGLKGAWNSVKNFFAGPNSNDDIDFEAMSAKQREMLEAQGLTEEVLAKKWRAGLTEPQKRVLRMLRYQQHEERVNKASASRNLLTASGVVNKGDTAAKAEKLMSDRDKAIARELNEKKFLSTKDAEAVVKDPNAQAGRLMNSPKTARNMLGMYKMLTKNEQSIFNFRLALLAYLVPSRRNTIYEVLSQSHDAGVVGKEDLTDPARMYETISPYVKEDIREKLPGKKQFPHEKVFMTMVDEYNELRDDARGVSKKDHKDLIENQKNMSIAEVARELLNPASGLALFARLRLLTDESITDADIKKHIDRLSPEEQVLVNEFMEKLAREQNIKFEDLKKYVEEQKELDEKLKAKEAELQKVMKKIHDLENGMYMAGHLNGKKETRDLDNKSKDLDREIRDLQEKKDKTAAKRPEMEKDYNERVEWKNEREAQAVTAVNKIRKDLFGLITATPTAYETDLEAQVPALRNRLLVITRLANRFLLDKFEETPDFEDKYKFKEYNPDREEVYQAQIKEEKAGTLGQSQATKDENKRKEEEEKARIAAEKEMRSKLASHGMELMDTVDENEQLLPSSLEDPKTADAKMVGMAINRVINTYLNFDPSIAAGVSDTSFPELIPRLLRYGMAAKQINRLLTKRKDANGALSEENLHTIRRALKVCKPIGNMISKRLAVLANPYFQEHTGAEYEEKMNQVQQQKEGAGQGEITKEQEEMYDLLQESKAAGEEVTQTVSSQEEKHTSATDNGQGYLDQLKELTNQLREAKPGEGQEDPKAEYYTTILQHMDSLHTALSSTFNEETDVPAKAAEIATLFGKLEETCNEYIKREGGGFRGDQRAVIAQTAGEMTTGMFRGFTAAAYKTVEILSKNNVFRNENHMWARVMVIGAPFITANESAFHFKGKISGRPTLDNEEAGTKKLSKDDIEAELVAQDRGYGDDTAIGGAKSLKRFRALLGSKDSQEMKKTMERYRDWDDEDEAHRVQLEEMELQREEVLNGKEGDKEEQEKENDEAAGQKEPPKTLEEQEIDQILAEQTAKNTAAKEGEENAVIEAIRNLRTKLGTYKTGVLGLFADKTRNTEVADLQGKIDVFLELLTKPILKLNYVDEILLNNDELKQEYVQQMEALYNSAHEIKFYALCRTGSDDREEQQFPFKGMCRSIYTLFKKYEKLLGIMKEMDNPTDIITSSVGESKATRKQRRYDISDYAMKQNQEEKLRYIFFLMRVGMTQGEKGYAAPEDKWRTKEEMLREQEQKKQKKKEEEESLKAMNSFRHSINNTSFDDKDEEEVHDEEEQDEIIDLDKSYDNLPGLDDDGQNQAEKIDEQVRQLEDELEDGEYEDPKAEHQLNPEQQKEAKAEAIRLSMEAAKALYNAKKARRSDAKLPTYQNLRAKAKKSKDDFAISGGLVEERPSDAVEVDIEQEEQKVVKNRNFVPGLRTRDKVAKVAGWTLFGGLHYALKPVKWLGTGAVKGVNFALRWAKKKKNGPDSMQKTSKIATQEKKDQIANEIEAVKSGKPDQPVNEDTSRVPMNWAVETAEDPNLEPTVTVGATGKANEDQTEFIEGNHTWMRLNYTKQDPRTGKNIRNRVEVGYGPRGGFTMQDSKGGAFNGASQIADGALMPGALWDERGHSFAAAKTYRASNRQINQILLEAERYPAGGFNLISRNCTTFVAEVTQNAGVNTSDILQKVPMRLGAKYLAVPLLSLLSPATKMLAGAHGTSKSGQDDLSFQRYGEKQVTEEELEQMGKDNGVQTEAFTPLNTMQAIQAEGGELNALSGMFNTKNPAKDPTPFIQKAGKDLQDAIRQIIGAQVSTQFSAMVTELTRLHANHQSDLFSGDQTTDDIVNKQKEFSREAGKASKFYYAQCHGDPRLRIPFLQYIGVLNRAKMVYDEHFHLARKNQITASFKDSDISRQLSALTFGKSRKYMINTKEGLKEMNSSPSLMIGYAKRGTSVEQSYELQKRNQGKEKLLNALDKSVDADTVNIWQKESFSEEDTDLAFSTMQEQQESLSHEKSEESLNYDFTGAEVMQALIFERIYAGMKGRIKAGNWFVKPGKNEEADVETYNKRSKQFLTWLKQDMEISAQSHPAEVALIEKSIGKRFGLDVENLDPNGRERIQKEYRTRFVESYLVPMLVEIIKKPFGKDQYFSIYGLLQSEYVGM